METDTDTETRTIPIVTPVRHLPLRIRPAVPLSDDMLYEFCAVNRELRIERTSEGDLIIMSPTGSDTGRRNFLLNGRLFAWAVQDAQGVGFDSSTGFILPNGAERAPDAAWVRKSRWQALTPAQREKFAPLCPDFVVELRSPTDRLPEIQAKLAEYLENGAQLGWLIDPIEGQVHVYRPDVPPEILDHPSAVSGDPVLRGFVLDLSEIL